MTEERPNTPSLRHRIIDHSRRQYAMPRAEAERIIAEQMGWPTPQQERDERKEKLLRRLVGMGVSEHEAGLLLNQFALDRIQQQLDWMSYRIARKPSAMVVAAIRRNYDPPAAVLGQPISNSRAAASSDSSSGEQRPNAE